jgi:hypothetical protein
MHIYIDVNMTYIMSFSLNGDECLDPALGFIACLRVPVISGEGEEIQKIYHRA